MGHMFGYCLKLNKPNLAGTSYMENISVNAEIMLECGVPEDKVLEHVSQSIDFAKKNGFK